MKRFLMDHCPSCQNGTLPEEHPLYRSPDEAWSEIYLESSQKFLLVEGMSDIRFLNRFIGKRCHVFALGGKQNLRRYHDGNPHRFPLSHVFMDADFDRIEHEDLGNTDEKTYTDKTDRETTVICSESFIKKIEQIFDIEGDRAKNVLEMAFKGAAEIGKVRYINKIKRINVDFKRLNFQEFLGEYGFISDKFYKHLLDLQRGNFSHQRFNEEMRNTSELIASINKLAENSAESICNGHDLCLIIAFYATLWSKNSTSLCQCCPSSIEECVNTAFSLDEFEKTNMSLNLEKWLASRNS
jgi:hypothetical protein